MADKRKFPRVKRRLVIEFRLAGAPYVGFTYNLSPFGLFVRSIRIPNLGSAISAELHLPDGKRIPAAGKGRAVVPGSHGAGPPRAERVRHDADRFRRAVLPVPRGPVAAGCRYSSRARRGRRLLVVRHVVHDGRDRAQVGEDRLQVFVGRVPVPHPGHRRLDRARRSEMLPRPDRLHEHLLRPDAHPRVLVGRQVGGIGHTEGAGKRRESRPDRSDPGPRRRRRGRHLQSFGVAREHPGHVGLRTAVRPHLPGRVAVVAAHDRDQVLPPLDAAGRRRRIGLRAGVGSREQGHRRQKKDDQRGRGAKRLGTHPTSSSCGIRADSNERTARKIP